MRGDRLVNETLYQSAVKRIGLTVWKQRGALVMSLQEWDRDPKDPGVETMALFHSWGPRIAVEPVQRATKAAVARFYAAHIEEARALVAERAKVL